MNMEACAHCLGRMVGAWLHFGMDGIAEESIMGCCAGGWPENTSAGRGAVCHQAFCCTMAKICFPFGCFPKHEHLISLWLIDFNGVYYYNFYNGVSESRVWPVATTVLANRAGETERAEGNTKQGGFKF